jgi:hypothetical protein
MSTATLSENDILPTTATNDRSQTTRSDVPDTSSIDDNDLTVASLTPDGEPPLIRTHGAPFSFHGPHGPILVTVDPSLAEATERLSNASAKPISHAIQSLVESVAPAVGAKFLATDVRLVASSLVAPDFHSGRMSRTLSIKVVRDNVEVAPPASFEPSGYEETYPAEQQGGHYSLPVGAHSSPLSEALASPASGLSQDAEGALRLKIALLEQLIEADHHDHSHCQPSIDPATLATAIAEALKKDKKPALFNFGGLNVVSLEVGGGHHGETWREMVPAILKEGGRSILKTMLSLAILSAVGAGVMTGLHAYDPKFPAPAGVSDWAKKNIALEAGMSTREGLGFKFVAKEGHGEGKEGSEHPAGESAGPHATDTKSEKHAAPAGHTTSAGHTGPASGHKNILAKSRYSKTAQAIISAEGGPGLDVRLLQVWIINANYINGEAVLSDGGPVFSRKVISEVQDFITHSAGVDSLEMAPTNPSYIGP